MSGQIGVTVKRETTHQTLARARARAALIPDILVEARRVASNAFTGWHGRRKRGIGEDFWQFRHYVPGENMSAIDWRRSARDDHIYVRDREWQAAHTVWLWVDESPSMLFKSRYGTVAKQSRALVIALALTELLARAGERVGWLGLTRPILSRHAAEKLGTALLSVPAQERLPPPDTVRNWSELVLFSDFLSEPESLRERLEPFAHNGARGHLIQIVDPVEEIFPYSGRIEFADPESGARFTAGNAGTLERDYRELFRSHVETVRKVANSLRWNHILHHTDKPASHALTNLHLLLTMQDRGAAA
jgi:uncharacterized protein (DUF58 family)